MSIPVLTFFNNKGGVGKTSLVYHLAWMFSEIGYRILAVDLDPQANLTSAFIKEEEIERLWETDADEGDTIFRCVKPLQRTGELLRAKCWQASADLYLLPGDLALSRFEDSLSNEWTQALGATDPYRAFRILTAFWTLMQQAAVERQSQLILVDVGPNLGAINRSALVATDFVIIPLGADLFSLQGLRNLGPQLIEWRVEWSKRLVRWQTPEFPLPKGAMEPVGYIANQPAVRLSRPVKAYDRWLNRMPTEYRRSVLGQVSAERLGFRDDPNCLALLKHYKSLVPMAQEARKPLFLLKAADGAIGSHLYAVREAAEDYRKLAEKILARVLPQTAIRESAAGG